MLSFPSIQSLQMRPAVGLLVVFCQLFWLGACAPTVPGAREKGDPFRRVVELVVVTAEMDVSDCRATEINGERTAGVSCKFPEKWGGTRPVLGLQSDENGLVKQTLNIAQAGKSRFLRPSGIVQDNRSDYPYQWLTRWAHNSVANLKGELTRSPAWPLVLAGPPTNNKRLAVLPHVWMDVEAQALLQLLDTPRPSSQQVWLIRRLVELGYPAPAIGKGVGFLLPPEKVQDNSHPSAFAIMNPIFPQTSLAPTPVQAAEKALETMEYTRYLPGVGPLVKLINATIQLLKINPLAARAYDVWVVQLEEDRVRKNQVSSRSIKGVKHLGRYNSYDDHELQFTSAMRGALAHVEAKAQAIEQEMADSPRAMRSPEELRELQQKMGLVRKLFRALEMDLEFDPLLDESEAWVQTATRADRLKELLASSLASHLRAGLTPHWCTEYTLEFDREITLELQTIRNGNVTTQMVNVVNFFEYVAPLVTAEIYLRCLETFMHDGVTEDRFDPAFVREVSDYLPTLARSGWGLREFEELFVVAGILRAAERMSVEWETQDRSPVSVETLDWLIKYLR